MIHFPKEMFINEEIPVNTITEMRSIKRREEYMGRPASTRRERSQS